MDKLEEKKIKRENYLSRLYDLVNGESDRHLGMYNVGKEIGLSNEEEINSIVSFLQKQKLIDTFDFGENHKGQKICLTHKGVLKIEKAREILKRETSRTPTVANVINIRQSVTASENLNSAWGKVGVITAILSVLVTIFVPEVRNLVLGSHVPVGDPAKAVTPPPVNNIQHHLVRQETHGALSPNINGNNNSITYQINSPSSKNAQIDTLSEKVIESTFDPNSFVYSPSKTDPIIFKLSFKNKPQMVKVDTSNANTISKLSGPKLINEMWEYEYTFVNRAIDDDTQKVVDVLLVEALF